MSALLLTRGVIHSVSDPYATSLLVADGLIAWLGADESADRVAGPEMERLDLGGAVLAPAFVEPAGTAADARTALGRGTAVVTVLDDRDVPGSADAGSSEADLPGTDRPDGGLPAAGPATPATQEPAADGGVQLVRYRAADVVDTGSAGVWIETGADLDVEALTGLLEASTRMREQVYLVPAASSADPERAQGDAIAALRAAADTLGAADLGRVRHRLVLTGPVDAEDRAFLARIAASVTVAPDAEGVLRAPLASLLADAVPVALGAGPVGDPWAAVRAAVAHPDPQERVSARSAFTAATRTGLRALPDVPAAAVVASPRLAVSAPATFAVWDTEAVAVQSPDGRMAAWSTDTRAGTPLLPALDAQTPLPTWRATWIDGERAAAAGSASRVRD